jgi:hypothetical protein
VTLCDVIAGPQGDILGLCRLWRDDAASDHGLALRQNAARLRTAEGLRAFLERRRADGYLAAVGLGHPELFRALGRPAAAALPVPLPVVPNLQGFMREAVEYGMLGAGLRRAVRVGPVALAGLGLRSVGRAASLLRRDFPTMLRSFVELELADFARYRPPVVFLQAQVTDLAVAMHNPRTLSAFCQAVRARTGAAPGLATCNLVSLTAALKTWDLEVAALMVPWNPGGRHMRPSAEACAQAAKGAGVPIWADRQGTLAPPDEAERNAYRRGGLIGAVRDDMALWMEPK